MDRVRIAQEFVRKTGVNRLGIEIHVPAEYFSPEGVERTRNLLEEFEQQVQRDWDVRIHRSMHFPFLPYNTFNLGDLDPNRRAKIKDLFKQSAQFAAEIGISVICTHLNATCTLQEWQNYYYKPEVRDRSMRFACETLRQVIPAFEESGFTLALENIPYPFESIYQNPPISPI